MRISDWSSDVCSSDLGRDDLLGAHPRRARRRRVIGDTAAREIRVRRRVVIGIEAPPLLARHRVERDHVAVRGAEINRIADLDRGRLEIEFLAALVLARPRSEEHTSELQSLMRNSYAVF